MQSDGDVEMSNAQAGPSRQRHGSNDHGSEAESDAEDDLAMEEYYSDQELSEQEWDPEEASDAAVTEDDDDDDIVQGSRRPSPTQPALVRPVPRGRGPASKLTPAQRKRIKNDAKGSDAWKQLSQKKRDRRKERSERQEEEDGEIEAAEMDRLMAGIPELARARTSAIHAEAEEPIDTETFNNELAAASGIRKKQKKMRRAMRRVDLSEEVQGLMTAASVAYVNEDLETAIKTYYRVIAIEPTVRDAWQTLAKCHEERGEIKQALQARTLYASLINNAIDLWIELGHDWYEAGYPEQTIHCWDKAIRSSRDKDRDDVMDVMEDKVVLLEEMGEYNKTVAAVRAIFKVKPHSREVVERLVLLLLGGNRIKEAIEVLEQSRDFNMVHFPDPTQGDGLELGSYSGSEVATLADLLNDIGEPLRSLHCVRQSARWLQGRGHESFWDEVIEDDREFDETREGIRDPSGRDYGRRVHMAPVYQPLDLQLRLRLAAARRHMNNKDEALRHYDLFMEHTDPDDSDETMEWWMIIADYKMEVQQYHDADDILHKITQTEFGGVEGTYIKMGICRQAMGRLEDAEEMFRGVLRDVPDSEPAKLRLAEILEDQGDRAGAVQLIREVVLARPESENLDEGIAQLPASEALGIFEQVWAHGIPDTVPDGTTRHKKKPLSIENRLQLEATRKKEAEEIMQALNEREADVFINGWWRADVVIGGAGNGSSATADNYKPRYGEDAGETLEQRQQRFTATKEWLELAGRLVDSYRNAPLLHPRERHRTPDRTDPSVQQDRLRQRGVGVGVNSQVNSLLSRIQDRLAHESAPNLPDSDSKSTVEGTYRGLEWDVWVELYLKYAFVLTKIGETDYAQQILDVLVRSLPVESLDRRKEAAVLGQAACAMYTRDHTQLYAAIRHLPYRWQFNNTAIRILTSLSHSAGIYGLEHFNEPRLSKMILRRLRLAEAIVDGRKHKFLEIQNRWRAEDKLQINRLVARDHSDEEGEEGQTPAQKKARKAQRQQEEMEANRQAEAEERQEEEEEEAAAAVKDASGRGITAARQLCKEPVPKKENPINELHYCYTLLIAGSYQGALALALRAYARLPSDPSICLTTAVCCFSRMTNRQVDNRHHFFLQGLTFLSMYRKLRSNNNQKKTRGWMEATYNHARALEGSGLISMAIPLYEEVLAFHDAKKNSKQKDDKDATIGFDCHREAAWNLAMLFVLNGNAKGARVLMNKYLTV